MKLLLWGVIFLLIVLWLMHDRKTQAHLSGASRKAEMKNKDVKNKDAENMVRCAQCGLHFPASEAVISQSGMTFCSDEHRRRHAG